MYTPLSEAKYDQDIFFAIFIIGNKNSTYIYIHTQYRILCDMPYRCQHTYVSMYCTVRLLMIAD
jgi:hypothetical protein